MFRVSKNQAIAKFKSLAEQGRIGNFPEWQNPRFQRWWNDCKAAIRNIFGADSPQFESLNRVSFSPTVISLSGDNDFAAEFRRGVITAVEMLESMATEIEEFWSDESDPANQNSSATQSDGGNSAVKIFVSHTDEDKQLASALVKCLLDCMILNDDQIRCTSVPGHMLPAGSDTANFLRNDLSSTSVVIALLTPNAIQSGWVMFELGAAWGANKHLVPLLANGLGFDQLPGPLGGRHAVRTNDIPQVSQAMDDIARSVEALSRTPAKKAAAIQALAQAADDVNSSPRQRPRPVTATASAPSPYMNDDYIIDQLLEPLHDDILRQLVVGRKAIEVGKLSLSLQIHQPHVEAAVTQLQEWGFVSLQRKGDLWLVALLPRGEGYVHDRRLLESKA